MEKKWKELIEKLSTEDDFPYQGIKPRKNKKYFSAKSIGNTIIINKAKTEELPSGEISIEREIDFKEFKCVALLYNNYVQREKGIRPKIRNSCGQNSSYIISLIASLL